MRVVLIACAMGGLVACGDDSHDGGGGTAFDELPQPLAETLCALIQDCLPGPVLETVYGPQGCEASVQADVEDSDFALIGDAIEAGRVEYDGTKAEACLQELAEVGCGFDSERVFLKGTCAELMVGTVDAGGDCSVDAECAGEAFCAIDNSCPGTCTSLRSEGQACDDGDHCQDGLSCDGTCKAVAARGERCGPLTACRLDDTCIPNATGIVGSCTSVDSVYAGAVGDSCDPDVADLCDPELSCALTIDGQQVGFECTERVGSGDDCTAAVPDMCPDGEYCADIDPQNGDLDGTCKALADTGDDCESEDDCRAGLACDEGKCAMPGRVGDDCRGDEGCVSGQCESDSCVQEDPCAQ